MKSGIDSLTNDVRRLLRTRYDLICPIGQWCAPAKFLRNFKLRTASQPFDWVDGHAVSLNEYVDLIRHGFRDYLDKEHLAYLKDSGEHSVYRNKLLGYVFVHDFASGLSLDVTWPAVKAKYDRRIARFMNLVKNAQRVLFVHYSVEIFPSENDMRTACQKLRDEFPGSRIDLLVLRHSDEAVDATICEISAGVYCATGRFFDQKINQVWGDTRLTNRIFGAIRLNGHWRNILSVRLSKLRMKCATMFHLSSAARRAARERYCNQQEGD